MRNIVTCYRAHMIVNSCIQHARMYSARCKNASFASRDVKTSFPTDGEIATRIDIFARLLGTRRYAAAKGLSAVLNATTRQIPDTCMLTIQNKLSVTGERGRTEDCAIFRARCACFNARYKTRWRELRPAIAEEESDSRRERPAKIAASAKMLIRKFDARTVVNASKQNIHFALYRK